MPTSSSPSCTTHARGTAPGGATARPYCAPGWMLSWLRAVAPPGAVPRAASSASSRVRSTGARARRRGRPTRLRAARAPPCCRAALHAAPSAGQAYFAYNRGVEHAADAPILVLSPHLDDAVLSAWSVIADAPDVAIVNVFARIPEPGAVPRWDLLTGALDSRAQMHERLDEDRAALALAGRSAIYLPFLDGQYRSGDHGTAELAAAVSAAVPAASILYAPAGIGAHADHVIVRDVAIGLSRRLGLPLALYAELPYAVRFGWPSWVTGAPADPRLVVDADWDFYLSFAPLQRAGLSSRVRRLDDAQMAAKLAAMTRYGTQFPALNQGPIRLLEHPLVLPWEVAWSVEADRA